MINVIHGVEMSGLPVSPLSEIFGGSSAANLIVLLVYNHDRDFSVQDLADRMKVSKGKVTKLKEGLLKYDVIKETRKVGKSPLLPLRPQQQVWQAAVRSGLHRPCA